MSGDELCRSQTQEEAPYPFVEQHRSRPQQGLLSRMGWTRGDRLKGELHRGRTHHRNIQSRSEKGLSASSPGASCLSVCLPISAFSPAGGDDGLIQPTLQGQEDREGDAARTGSLNLQRASA